MEKVGAIDIGSNAIRASVAGIKEKKATYNILLRDRVPIRLGKEAFMHGRFSDYTMSKMIDSFSQFRETFDDYNVHYVRAVATSAFREAANSAELCEKIFDKTGIVIHEIDGIHEAQMIYSAVRSVYDLKNKNALLMDVGGGSLEITVISSGKFIESQSFNLGTVRLLNILEQKKSIDDFLSSHIEKIDKFLKPYFSQYRELTIIGTGGNARRLGKLRAEYLDKETTQKINKKEVDYFFNELKNLTPLKRVQKYNLRLDRAEVIVPAIQIFKSILDLCSAKQIVLPRVGLIHGIFEEILQINYPS